MGSSAHSVLVVSETERLGRMARNAAEKLGKKLRSERAVKAEAKRFGDRIAANPSALRVEIFEVVGFCDPTRDQPCKLEPIVLHEGKPMPVTMSFAMVAGEYWVGTPEEIARRKPELVAACARNVAERLLLGEALMAAVDEADVDAVLSGITCDPRTSTVELEGDPDGKIAKRLPGWITVKKP